MYIDPNSGGMLFQALLVLFLVVSVIIVVVIAIVKINKKEVAKYEVAFNQILQTIPQEQQVLFLMQYESKKKNPTIAIVLTLFLGGLGAHKFYMGQTGMGILYLVFVWTFIPALIAFIEAFTMAGQVSKYNRGKAAEVASMINKR